VRCRRTRCAADDDAPVHQTATVVIDAGHAIIRSAARSRGNKVIIDQSRAGINTGAIAPTEGGAEGLGFLQKASLERLEIPILMRTGSNTENDVVRGLDTGANDYIVKPFRLNELLARLRAKLRSFESIEDAVFTIGPYVFRPAAKQLVEPRTLPQSSFPPQKVTMRISGISRPLPIDFSKVHNESEILRISDSGHSRLAQGQIHNGKRHEGI
jgi:CheY-like chemotaxis protein